MDFFNKHFYQLTRRVDPTGMLNVPYKAFVDSTCLRKYFRTDNDFKKLDVAVMCDQLILLLNNFDEFSSSQYVQNDFRRIKYSFIMISQAFLGLVIIHKNSNTAYCNYFYKMAFKLYRNKIFLNEEPRSKKRRKQDTSNRPQQNIQEMIENEHIEMRENQEVLHELNLIEKDVWLNQLRQIEYAAAMNPPEVFNTEITNILIPQNINTIVQLNNNEINEKSNVEQLNIQPIEMLPVSDQNLMTELSENKLDHLVNVIQSTNTEFQQSNEQHIQPSSANGSQQNLPSQSPNKKKTNVKKNFKKRPIEQNSKTIKKRLKKLEEELPDRPLESIALKYIQESMNHLSLRYNMHRNEVDIPFAGLTLNMEVEQNKDQNDIFNNELTMRSFKAITEKSNSRNISNSCIYQQCMNNSLPHLSLLPLAEEYLTNNSIVWRNTINEINKKLSDSLKDISSFSKSNPSKWEEFKEKMKHKVNHSLVAHKTLVGSDLSRINIPQQPHIVFPSPDELLNGNSIIERHNSAEVSEIIQNPVEPIEICQRQPIDVIQMISNILKQSTEKTYLMFTDLCPTHATSRKTVFLVMSQLLNLHYKRIIILSQPHNNEEPSSISIQLKREHFL